MSTCSLWIINSRFYSWWSMISGCGFCYAWHRCLFPGRPIFLFLYLLLCFIIVSFQISIVSSLHQFNHWIALNVVFSCLVSALFNSFIHSLNDFHQINWNIAHAYSCIMEILLNYHLLIQYVFVTFPLCVTESSESYWQWSLLDN